MNTQPNIQEVIERLETEHNNTIAAINAEHLAKVAKLQAYAQQRAEMTAALAKLDEEFANIMGTVEKVAEEVIIVPTIESVVEKEVAVKKTRNKKPKRVTEATPRTGRTAPITADQLKELCEMEPDKTIRPKFVTLANGDFLDEWNTFALVETRRGKVLDNRFRIGHTGSFPHIIRTITLKS